jgi:hypothetical protein
MTREREVVRAAVLAGSLRSVAAAIGVSHQTVKDLIDNPDETSPKTWEKVRDWMARQEDGPDAADATGTGLRRILTAAGMDETTRAWQLAEYAAAIRAEALLEEARAAGERARAVTADARGALVRAKVGTPTAIREAEAEPVVPTRQNG